MVSVTSKILFISICIPIILHIFPSIYKYINFNVYDYKHIIQCYRLFLSLFINILDIKLLFELLFRYNILRILEECTSGIDILYFIILSSSVVFVSSLENVYYTQYINSSLVIYLSLVTDQQFMVYGIRVDPKYLPVLSICMDILGGRYKIYYPIGYALFYNYIIKNSKDYIPECIKNINIYIDNCILSIINYKFERTIKKGRVLGKRIK